jgi:heme exporter protein B
MQLGLSLKALAWLVAKDLRIEMRARRAWAGMLLLGLVLVVLAEIQLDLAAPMKQQVICGLLWLDIFFAGVLALDRSMAGEREDGCWQTLLLYPITPGVIFLAKITVNAIALFLLESILVLALAVFANVPLLDHPWAFGLVALLGNLGFASVGVLLSALTAGLSQRGGLLALLVLPLTIPVILGAAEATRLLLSGGSNDIWWSWLQLLAAFAVLFTALGMLLFEFVLEE